MGSPNEEQLRRRI
ncbi:hypothetical protein NQ315_005390, partial [Exocentrus adspersus]